MKGFCILVVEDEVLLQRVIEEAARLFGLPCEVARTAQEAIERLQYKSYDLLIQDVRLPDSGGATVIQHARQLDPTLPVILTTAYTTDIEAERALQQGVDAVLYKPFDIDTLLATIRHLLLKRLKNIPTHAVVQMPSVTAVPSKDVAATEWSIPPTNALVMLHLEGKHLIGRVYRGDELVFCVQTPPERESTPARLQVEFTGSDALYRFWTRLVEHGQAGESDWWLLKRPRQITRVQRRCEPRLPVMGHATLSVVGRMPRTTQGTLVDLSAHGIALKLPLELNRGTHLRLLIEWHDGETIRTFQSEGVVRHTLAQTEAGNPLYLTGVELAAIPRNIRALIRQRLLERLRG